jgi:hypothetical protein
MGMFPKLTDAQRAAAAFDRTTRNKKRSELHQAIRALQAELTALPTNEEIGAKHGISVRLLLDSSTKTYKTKHPDDRTQRA